MDRKTSSTSTRQSLALRVQAICNRRRADHLRRRASRQVICAVRKIPLRAARNAQDAQLRHSRCESGIPFARLADKALELLANNCALVREVDV